MAFLICANCGKEFHRPASQVRTKHGVSFCSRECFYSGKQLTERIVDKPYKNRGTSSKTEHTCETCGKAFLAYAYKARRFCSVHCSFEKSKNSLYSPESIQKRANSRRGRKDTEEQRRRKSEALRALGERHPSYVDGLGYSRMDERQRAWRSLEYRLWREAVFARDGHRCVVCNSGGPLNADHIKRWRDYPHLRYEVSNGRTLCVDCHKKTDTYGRKG